MQEDVKPVIEEPKTEVVESIPAETKAVEKKILVKPGKFRPLVQVARNKYQSPCGSLYFKNDNGSLIRINKSETPNKRERARMRRKLKNENANNLNNRIG